MSKSSISAAHRRQRDELTIKQVRHNYRRHGNFACLEYNQQQLTKKKNSEERKKNNT